MTNNRAQYILSLLLREDYNHDAFLALANQQSQQYQQFNPYSQQFQQQQPPQQKYALSWRQTKELEDQLKRQDPDLLDQLRFAMDDRDYGTLVRKLAQGAFWAAAIYASPFLVGPLIVGRAIARSRLKQIERRSKGIQPRYHLRPTDTY